jgi:hypothetical protein
MGGRDDGHLDETISRFCCVRGGSAHRSGLRFEPCHRAPQVHRGGAVTEAWSHHCLSLCGTPDDIPADAAAAGRYERRATPQSAEEIRLGRELGDRVASELAKRILDLGMPAELAGSGPLPRQGDLVIRGEFVSIDEGSRMKRMLIGFGAGATQLKTHVDAYEITAKGPRRLGSAAIEAGGGKMPGMLVPVGAGAAAGRVATSAAVSGGLAVVKEGGPESIQGAAKRTAEEIAKLLSQGFVRQGWIPPHRAK